MAEIPTSTNIRRTRNVNQLYDQDVDERVNDD